MERKPLLGYYANHRALRKDIKRLETAVSKFDTYTKADWKKITAWFNYHARLVYFHHHGEDDFFFPFIKQRSSRFNAEMLKMDDEHKSLDKFMERMKTILSALAAGGSSKQEFANAVHAYGQIMITHLDGEEKVVERVINEEFTRDEIFKAEDDYVKQMTDEQRKISLAWMVDVMDDDEKKMFFSRVPFIVKWIYKLVAKPKFEKAVSCI